MFGSKHTPKEIHIRIESAEVATAERIEQSQEKVLYCWKEAFLEECERWMDEKHLTREELVFLLCHVGRELDEELL